MAVNPREERSYFSYPRFVKVITVSPDQGLKIPYAFMRKYGYDLQDSVFLKLSNGDSWQVELVHYENHGALLKKGWENFSEYYSIKRLYFVAFKYEGNSQFLVNIFNLTAVEIEYPVSLPTSDRRSQHRVPIVSKVSNQDEEISDTILEENGLKVTTQDLNGKRSLDDDSIEIVDDPSAFRSKPFSGPNQKMNKGNSDWVLEGLYAAERPCSKTSGLGIREEDNELACDYGF